MLGRDFPGDKVRGEGEAPENPHGTFGVAREAPEGGQLRVVAGVVEVGEGGRY